MSMLITYISGILEECYDSVNITYFVKNAYKYIEKNEYLSKYKDFQLYNHQKRLFAISKE